jgi:hypothetical protein
MTTAVIAHELIASDKIEGTVVRRPGGDKLGKIERLMIDRRTGTVAYAVLSFGGLFGLGHDHYPIPWSLLTYNPASKAYEIEISDERLSHAGESFSNLDFGDRAQEAKLHARYGARPYWGAE